MIIKYIKKIRQKNKEQKAMYAFFWSVFFTMIFVFFQFFTPYINFNDYLQSTTEYNSNISTNTNIVDQNNNQTILKDISQTFNTLTDNISKIKQTTKNIQDLDLSSTSTDIAEQINNTSPIDYKFATTSNNTKDIISGRQIIKNVNVENIEALRKKTGNLDDTNSKTNINISGIDFTVYLAISDKETALGLSHSKELCKTCAMLFVFAEYRELSFWMKDMKYNIDIIYLDSNGKIINIHENLSPDSYPKLYKSTSKAKYAIEMNAGMARNIGLKSGNTITLNGF